ncbi:protein transport protein sec31-like [Oxyura jamaicensis]|uniref:protein transport protein sec31-like n=1 Tax=Oxyura jamaicensis TaxID=8884 RepID=UPI0015A5AA3B|nr:protein transport protein sec31-like [Oxyura jamaicensis]
MASKVRGRAGCVGPTRAPGLDAGGSFAFPQSVPFLRLPFFFFFFFFFFFPPFLLFSPLGPPPAWLPLSLCPSAPALLLSPSPRPAALPLPHPARPAPSLLSSTFLPPRGPALAFCGRDVRFISRALISCQVGPCRPPRRAAVPAGAAAARGWLGGGAGRGRGVGGEEGWRCLGCTALGRERRAARQAGTHTRARTHTKSESEDNPKKDSLCLDDSTQLIIVSPLSVASPSCRCCCWQRRERLKVTHRGPPPPLPRAARHPPPPRSPRERPLGERRCLLPPSPPVALFFAEGVRSRLPLPLSSAPEPAVPRPLAPARSSPLRSAPPGSARHRDPPGRGAGPCRLGTPGRGQAGGWGWGKD